MSRLCLKMKWGFHSNMLFKKGDDCNMLHVVHQASVKSMLSEKYKY